MIDPFRIRLKPGSDNCQTLMLKVRIRNINHSGVVLWTFLSKKELNGPMNLYWWVGSTKDIITYNQLNITQWMSGFCRILRDENCQKIRDHTLDYLIALLDDSNDFSWQAAKASHAGSCSYLFSVAFCSCHLHMCLLLSFLLSNKAT